ncbi:MAG: Recombination protein RecR [candidate division TM6 bacterium GW2011_GWF2_30_66]|jgi:recombination protein RecR|nr:MAG: Recombination protein RecR [candidate division TM6 bacterium GW2011_GWF2_30_66]
MLENIPSLNNLLKSLQQVPYLASKNLNRVATYFLDMDEKQLQKFCDVLVSSKNNVLRCEKCFSWYERGSNCIFCSDNRRDQSIVCVVETWQELLTIERTGGYIGVYHVLCGVICPLEGIGPDDLTIEPLVSRIDLGVKEIILATNQTPEGEATAAYISKKLKIKNIKVSCLARGIPVGSSLEFMDRLTVYKAISERRPF